MVVKYETLLGYYG